MILKDHENFLLLDLEPLRRKATDAAGRKVILSAIHDYETLKSQVKDLKVPIYAERAYGKLTEAGITLSTEDFRLAFLERDAEAMQHHYNVLCIQLENRLIDATMETERRLHYRIADDLKKIGDDIQKQHTRLISVFENPEIVTRTHWQTLLNFVKGIREIGDRRAEPGYHDDPVQRYSCWFAVGEDFRAAAAAAISNT